MSGLSFLCCRMKGYNKTHLRSFWIRMFWFLILLNVKSEKGWECLSWRQACGQQREESEISITHLSSTCCLEGLFAVRCDIHCVESFHVPPQGADSIIFALLHVFSDCDKSCNNAESASFASSPETLWGINQNSVSMKERAFWEAHTSSLSYPILFFSGPYLVSSLTVNMKIWDIWEKPPPTLLPP